MKSVFFIFIYLFLNAFCLAEAKEINEPSEREFRFTPHITAEAWTGKQWSVSLQRSVGSNLNTNFLLSSLSLSVTNRLEVGTSPTLYVLEDHMVNLSLKYNFWRTTVYLWSIGFNTSAFKLRDGDGNQLEESLNLLSFQILLNYLPQWTNFKFGVNLNFAEAIVDSPNPGVDEFSLDEKWEFGVDITKPFHGNKEVTLGMGWLRESGFSALEKVEFGLGVSFRLYRPGKFISSPTVGVHSSVDGENVSFLVSTSFY